MKSITLAINKNNLLWARESLNLSLTTVAKKMSIKEKTVEDWENVNNDAYPTYSQLEKLAYQIYRRPIVIFFLDEIPFKDDILKSFRMLSQEDEKSYPTSFIKILRKAEEMQINIKELSTEKDYMESKLEQLFSNKSVDEVRRTIGVSLQEISKLKTYREALELWRNKIQNCGVFVFKDSFKYDDISGFCIYDQKYPIIYLNNSMPLNRQIFTLVHELMHLVTNKFSVIDGENIETVDNNEVERKVNELTAELLVPTDDFENQTDKVKIDYELVNRLSLTYKVSNDVILRKLLIIGKINNNGFLKIKEEIRMTMPKKKAKTSGGDYYANKKQYLGKKYMELVLRNLYQNKISYTQASEYMTIKEKFIHKIESNL